MMESIATTKERSALEEGAYTLDSLLEYCYKSGTKEKPCDVVAEWLLLTDSSIADITIYDVSHAATVLLDPNNVDCSAGRSALIALMMRQHGEEMKMEEPSSSSSSRNVRSTSRDENTESDEFSSKQQHLKYLPCQREIESWLIWVAVNLLWRSSNRIVEALSLCAKGINITTSHIQKTSKSQQIYNEDTSLYPLLSRLNRYSILIAENGMGQKKECDKFESGNRLAMLRSSVNSRAELLNLKFMKLKVTNLLNENQVEKAKKLIQTQSKLSRYAATTSASDEPSKICHHLYPHLAYHPAFST